MTSLGVVLFTYNRLEYAKRALRFTLARLTPDPKLTVYVHIASDGDHADYISELVAVAGEYRDIADGVTWSNSERKGYGANYNRATQVVHARCEYMLALEDDWELLKPFDPYAMIEDMRRLHIGCARLGYIGYTQELRAIFMHGVYCNHWLRLDPTSAEPHVFAGHPRIESREWSREVGPWPEELAPGDTEFAVAKIVSARTGVGWPLSLIRPEGDLYAHFGSERSY